VSVRFQDAWALLAVSFFQGLDVSVEHVSTRVQTAMVQQPAKKFNFDKKLGLPHFRRPRVHGEVGCKGFESQTRGERFGWGPALVDG
jgi:hypothetical protein